MRLLEAPHTSPNYLMREMVYQIGRDRSRSLRLVTLAAGVAIPLLVALFALMATLPAGWYVLALIFHLVGTIASRWLFFAEAQHVVSLYYGQR